MNQDPAGRPPEGMEPPSVAAEVPPLLDSAPPALPPDPPVIPPAPPRAPDPVVHHFTFHGDSREYFRIWIVNTLLTLLTCGVYLAWAKVRKRRYLRGSTELMGHRFDYRADPRRILAGNVLIGLVFVAYMLFGEVYPAVRLVALLIGLVLLPWVVVRSLAFNAHNTSYRGMRFYSRQTYGWAAITFIGQWFFIILSLGLYYPAWVRNRKQFVVNSHGLGDAFFRFESPAGPFYGAYLVSGGMILGAAVLGSTITTALVLFNQGKVPGNVQMIPFFAIYGFALFCSKHYVYARLFNQIWNNTRLDQHRFVASLDLGEWFGLQLTNLGALLISGGLLYPWTVIRSARYALSRLRFVPAGPIEAITPLRRSGGSALGETAAEFVGLDFGL